MSDKMETTRDRTLWVPVLTLLLVGTMPYSYSNINFTSSANAEMVDDQIDDTALTVYDFMVELKSEYDEHNEILKKVYDVENNAIAASSELTCLGYAVTIEGTAGDDIIAGTPGHDVIHGLGGNDVIAGLAGHDVICGGLGDDFLDGGPG
ncbi:MAG: hypothetical protein ACRD5H_08625, partial [Nitrososphaerales archaeon]